jgi:16S rRNA (guanine1207-N2)-methyltransferase
LLEKYYRENMEEHYYNREQKSKVITTPISFSFHGKTVKLDCVSGTFSSKGIDFASSLLLHHAKVEEGWDVLDLGCGIGVIGICVKKAFSDCSVTMTDVNNRALQFAEKNAAKNKLDVMVLASDLFEGLKGKKFDTIISNPPHHAGRKVVYQLIDDSVDYLKKGGYLQTVAKHTKGGKMIMQRMEAAFGNCEVLVKKGGVRVYCSRKE